MTPLLITLSTLASQEQQFESIFFVDQTINLIDLKTFDVLSQSLFIVTTTQTSFFSESHPNICFSLPNQAAPLSEPFDFLVYIFFRGSSYPLFPFFANNKKEYSDEVLLLIVSLLDNIFPKTIPFYFTTTNKALSVCDLYKLKFPHLAFGSPLRTIKTIQWSFGTHSALFDSNFSKLETFKRKLLVAYPTTLASMQVQLQTTPDKKFSCAIAFLAIKFSTHSVYDSENEAMEATAQMLLDKFKDLLDSNVNTVLKNQLDSIEAPLHWTAFFLGYIKKHHIKHSYSCHPITDEGWKVSLTINGAEYHCYRYFSSRGHAKAFVSRLAYQAISSRNTVNQSPVNQSPRNSTAHSPSSELIDEELKISNVSSPDIKPKATPRHRPIQSQNVAPKIERHDSKYDDIDSKQFDLKKTYSEPDHSERKRPFGDMDQPEQKSIDSRLGHVDSRSIDSRLSHVDTHSKKSYIDEPSDRKKSYSDDSNDRKKLYNETETESKSIDSRLGYLDSHSKPYNTQEYTTSQFKVDRYYSEFPRSERSERLWPDYWYERREYRDRERERAPFDYSFYNGFNNEIPYDKSYDKNYTEKAYPEKYPNEKAYYNYNTRAKY